MRLELIEGLLIRKKERHYELRVLRFIAINILIVLMLDAYSLPELFNRDR